MIKLMNGDCLEEYKNGMSMRDIATKHHTNHKLISRILKQG